MGNQMPRGGRRPMPQHAPQKIARKTGAGGAQGRGQDALSKLPTRKPCFICTITTDFVSILSHTKTPMSPPIAQTKSRKRLFALGGRIHPTSEHIQADRLKATLRATSRCDVTRNARKFFYFLALFDALKV